MCLSQRRDGAVTDSRYTEPGDTSTEGRDKDSVSQRRETATPSSSTRDNGSINNSVI